MRVVDAERTPSNGAPAIFAQGLTKSYDRSRGIVDVDLQIEHGQVVGLVGENGAGKTTLMRTLLDFIRPTAGSVQVLGLDTVRDSVAVRREVSYLPGEFVVPPALTGHEVVRRYSFARSRQSPDKVRDLADRLDLDLTRRVGDLSKGNKQKLGLVLALAPPVRLMVLDKPTSGLDPLLQREFAAIIREIVDDGGTVLLSSHVMSEVEQVADHVALMREGKLAAYESLSSVMDRARRRGRVVPRSPDVGQALGEGLRRTAGVSDVEADDRQAGAGADSSSPLPARSIPC